MSADLKAAAQQALDWLYDNDILHPTKVSEDLRAALAQQAEPVEEPAYKVKVAGRWHEAEPLAAAFNLPDGEHLLYTAPPQRPAKPVE